MDEFHSLDPASTVFDGKLSFVLGCQKQRVRQELRPSPAHSSEADTASRYLTEKISDFLKRTDHVMEEWSNHCKATAKSRHCDVVSLIEERRGGDEMCERLARSKSVTNILIKGHRMAKSMPPTVRSSSVCREGSRPPADPRPRDDDEDTVCDEEVQSASGTKLSRKSRNQSRFTRLHSINTHNSPHTRRRSGITLISRAALALRPSRKCSKAAAAAASSRIFSMRTFCAERENENDLATAQKSSDRKTRKKTEETVKETFACSTLFRRQIFTFWLCDYRLFASKHQLHAQFVGRRESGKQRHTALLILSTCQRDFAFQTESIVAYRGVGLAAFTTFAIS